MASKYVEEWLSKGLSLPKFLLRTVGAVGGGVTVISLIKYLRGVPYGADIAFGLLFVTIWALSETFRVKTIHKRYVKANPAVQQNPTTEPIRSNPTPGHAGHLSVGFATVVDPFATPQKHKDMKHGPIWGGYQSGGLPVHVTSEGPSGDRDMKSQAPHEIWSWCYENVTLVNESDEYLTFHVWLVVDTPEKASVRELRKEPNLPVTLAPHETRQEAFVFRMPLMGFSEEGILHPGRPRELQLIEDGANARRRVIDYRPRTEK